MIGRRTLIVALSATSIAPRLSAWAQPQMPVVGYLSVGDPAAAAFVVAPFREVLRQNGYVEGSNVLIEFRWAEGQYERLAPLAAELAQRQVAVIVALGGPAALAAKQATTSIPIIFRAGADPVELGLVASFSRPDGNATGISLYTAELMQKRLQILRELLPNARSVALLVNPAVPTAASQLGDVQAAVRAAHLELFLGEARTAGDLEPSFARLVERRPDALLMGSDPFFASQRRTIVALTAHYRLPAIYEIAEFATEGGLISYGPNIVEMDSKVATYAAKVLGGTKPSELPVQQPTRFELVLNIKTANALGLTIPPSLLARADEVIE